MNTLRSPDSKDPGQLEEALRLLFDQESIKLGSLTEYEGRKRHILLARRAEINNLLLTIQMSLELKDRKIASEDFPHDDVICQTRETLEAMLADEEFAGGHQFTIDEYDMKDAAE